MTVVQQKSFAGGIMGPMMLGRSDDEKYKAGLKVCRNFICLPQGAVENRAGFEYIRETKYADKRARLIPFVYSRDQSWVIEFGEKYIRFHTNGGTLLNDNGTPYEITSPYSADDVMDLHYAQSGDVIAIVHHKYRPMELRRYSLRDWRFTVIEFNSRLDPPTGVKAEKASAADEEINADKYTFKYCVTALNADRTVQSERSEIAWCTANIYNNGTTIKVSWNAVAGAYYYRVYKNEGGTYAYIGETEGLEIVDDNIAPDADYTPPKYEDPFNASNGISSITVTNSGSNYSNVTGGVASLTGMSVEPQSRYHGYDPYTTDFDVTIYDEANSGYGATAELVTEEWTTEETEVDTSGDSTSYYNYYVHHVRITSIKITNVGRAYLKPKAKVVWWQSRKKGTLMKGSDGKDWIKYYDLEKVNYAPTARITDSTGSGAELQVEVADGKINAIKVTKPGSGYSNPTVVIDAGTSAGSGASAKAVVASSPDYPQCVTYFEQRRVFASTTTQPQAVWMTQTGTESQFSYRIPTRSDDRVSFKIASRERHEIRHMIPLNRLLVLTEAGEWVVTSTNDAITPSTVQVKSQAFNGANMVTPLIVNNSILYVSNRGGHVRELGYNYNAGGYVTGDLSIRCAQLFDNFEIYDSALSRAPQPIAWFVSSSGSLLGFTYIPDQNISAWHEHTTDGRFESVCVISEGTADSVYCVIQRTINGQTKRFVERMAKRDKENLSDSFFVDCGMTYRGEETKELSGLSWLEGKVVSILADGSEKPMQTVTDGKITLDYPARVITVGLPIDAQITTLPAIVPLQNGGDAGSVQKNVSSVFLRVYNSSGVYVAPEDGELIEYKQRTTELPGTPPQTITGGINCEIHPEWNDTGSVTIKQEAPLPLTILSIACDIDLGG